MDYELESDSDIETSNCISCFEEFENYDEYNDLCEFCYSEINKYYENEYLKYKIKKQLLKQTTLPEDIINKINSFL